MSQPIVVTDPRKARPFHVSRYVKQGSRCGNIPRVTRIVIADLKVENMTTVYYDSELPSVSSGGYCKFHAGCLGHLRYCDNGGIAFPSYFVADDPDTMSERDYFNNRMITGSVSPSEFSNVIKDSLLGKRSFLRYGMTGFRPLTAMRGVASCSWPDDWRSVYVPRAWLEKVKVPYRETSEDGRYMSPYFSFRPLRDGDRAILTRCPVMTDNSVQPVRVYAHDGPSIKVHPSMCSQLNLDFDGDEVHVQVVADPRSISELDAIEANNPMPTFTLPLIKEAFLASMPMTDEDAEDYVTTRDWMVPSTVSMKNVRIGSVNTPLHKMCRMKASAVETLMKYLNEDDSIVSDFVDNSIVAMETLANSHLHVSDTYMFMRQLRSACMETSTKSMKVSTKWSTNPVKDYAFQISVPKTYLSSGLPGARIASFLSDQLMQRMLDKAKHIVQESESDIVLSLMGDIPTHDVFRMQNGEYRVVKSEARTATQELGGVLLCSTDRDLMCSFSDIEERYKKTCFLVGYVCLLMGLSPSTHEVAELAHTIMSMHDYSRGMLLSSQTPTKFMTRCMSSIFVSAICDDMKSMEKSVSECDHRHLFESTVESPSVTSSYGN